MDYKNMQEIANAIPEESLLVVSLGQLRQAAGYERLGRGVLDELSTQLRGQGVDYFPASTVDDNPQPRATDEIRLVRIADQIGKIVKAVQEPTEAGDEILKNVSSNEAASILQKVKLLVD